MNPRGLVSIYAQARESDFNLPELVSSEAILCAYNPHRMSVFRPKVEHCCWVQFIGIVFDYNHLEGDDGSLNSFRTGAEFGIKYFMRPNMAITVAAGGAWNGNSLSEGDDFQKQINLGLQYYF